MNPNHLMQRPNIIIFYTDDMGFGDVAIQNPDSKIPTPNLDQLARDGMRFTDGHGSSAICTPSRYSLLTGRYHWRDFHHIVHGMLDGSKFKPGQYTLPRMLKEQGYRTAMIGKWHLGWDFEKNLKPGAVETKEGETAFYGHEAFDWSRPVEGGPISIGFDTYFGDDTINFPPYTWFENDRVAKVPTTNIETPKNARIEGNWELRPGPAEEGWDFFKVLPTLTERAVEFVEGQAEAEDPFFLYMAFPTPHSPIIPNDEFVGKSGAGLYGDFVCQTDWCIGQIQAALERAGKTEDTLVIFSSDNGAESYAYARKDKFGHWSSEPFRGLKRDLYEGGHHVPFIVKWPGHIPAGTVNHQLMSQVDILQTLAAITGGTLPDDAAHDSYDFSSQWLESPHADQPAVRSVAVQNTWEDAYAIRMGDWMLIDWKTGHHTESGQPRYPEENAEGQLFHLGEDLGQLRNRYDEFPERVEAMRRELTAIRAGSSTAPRLER